MNLLTIEDVAAELDISVSTLRFYRLKGEGPKSFLLGRRVRYRRSDVEAWVEGQYQRAS